MRECEQWDGFEKGWTWERKIDVRNFIRQNLTPYEGDADFLAPPTEKTNQLKNKMEALFAKEREKGVIDAETTIPASITAFGAAYIDKDLEEIVGLQTDKPLKRAIMPKGGIRLVKTALESYGFTLTKEGELSFGVGRKSHNDGVFSAYTAEMKRVRSSGILTGLPDAYGRGRIIGDYRRVSLYGVDRLIEDKERQRDEYDTPSMTEENTRGREEITDQITALNDLKKMAKSYGFDISVPASTAKEAVQWCYFGYLAATKEQDGAAMSLGRVSSFLDIYIERDIKQGLLKESTAQELIDHFVIKLRMIRFLRTPAYNELFSGDPTWVTEAIGGMSVHHQPLVTKTSFRFLHTLENLGPAPEPNLTVLWSPSLPEGFRNYCAKLSIATSAIQYENDAMMRTYFGDDYGIACCVSAMKLGKQMQFFGARANLAKALLYAINGGKDEISGVQVAPPFEPVRGDYLEYNDIIQKFDIIMEWLAGLYIKTLNVIHYMHDKYNYESLQMALHDNHVERTMACGVAGLSVAVDSLSAIKHAKVKIIRDKDGLAIDYDVEGEYPAFGNNDNRVDSIAADLVERFMDRLRKQQTYRHATPTLSILTITSNVVYGKKTGSTPDGRKAGSPFGPGANPMHGRDTNGALATFASVAKIPYEHSKDGISYTFSIVPKALGHAVSEQINNLSALITGYFMHGGHHVNVNVLNKETLLDAMEHPENYPQLTVRVSGYAVNFIRLTKEQQMDVIHRTFHTLL